MWPRPGVSSNAYLDRDWSISDRSSNDDEPYSEVLLSGEESSSSEE